MDMEELCQQKDSNHQASEVQLKHGASSQINVQTIEVERIEQPLTNFFENEYHACQKELLQTKSALYE